MSCNVTCPIQPLIAQRGQRTTILALGASLALSRSRSIPEFMERAAFAVHVQSKEEDQQQLPVIWTRNGPRSARIVLSGRQGATVFISCCPLALHDQVETVDKARTFQFQSLAGIRKGDYTMSLDYERSDPNGTTPDQVVLTIEDNEAKNFSGRKQERWPLYYDPGSCVCFIDVENSQHFGTGRCATTQRAPTRIKNKKGMESQLQWEVLRLDPGRVYWDDCVTKRLSPATLQDFEMPELTYDEADIQPPE